MDDSIPYCTREDVKQAADFTQTARNDSRIDRALLAASRSIDGLCHRTFYPETDTRFWDWPSGQYARPWRLWLDASELISVTAVSSGGVDIPLDIVLLEPNQYGPPYNQLQVNISSSSGFVGGFTHQRDISITGLFGYRDDTTATGTTASGLDATQTTLDVTAEASALLGVGSLIRLDEERILVTGRRQLDTGQTITTDLDVQSKAVLVHVTDGTQFTDGEVILIDGERVLIVDIAGNTLSVRRSWDGSTLAAHTTGAAVYAPRRLTVRRAVLGTVAAIHTSGAPVQRWDPPALVRQLAIGEALATAGLESAGYSLILRSGEGGTERRRDESGIKALRAQVYDTHGRKARARAV